MSRKQLGQRGVVSIMVTMIMMLVISLIVIGFSQVARRNQREALDRQLSSQAYYAAETGVNDAVAYLKANPTASINDQDCTTFMNRLGGGSAQAQLASGVAYTCLSVNSAPTTPVKAPMALTNTVVWPLVDSSGANLTSLTFTWGKSAAGGSGACSNSSPFPKFNNWNCPYGILRVDLLTGDAVGSLSGTSAANSANLANHTHTLYLVPYNSGVASGSTSANIAAFANKGGAVYIKPPTSGSTMSTTIGLTGSALSSKYYARITMMYADAASVVASATNASGAAKLVGAQAVVVSTGKAQDELRRLQVRVPLTGQSDTPQYAVQSTGSLCKKFTVVPNSSYTDSAGCTP